MKRFISSFIFVTCLHAIIIFLIISLNPTAHLETTAKLGAEKKRTFSIWDIYQKKELPPKPEANLIPEPIPVLKPKSESKPEVKITSQKPSVVKKRKSIIKTKRVEKKVTRDYETKLKSTPSKLKTNKRVKITKSVKSTDDNAKVQAHVSRKLLEQEFQIKLLRLVKSRLEYPSFAKRMEHEGIVKVQLEVLGNGEFSLIRIYSSSNFKSLDDNAVELVGSLSSIITNKLNQKIRMIIPVEYKLFDRN